jgi:hypothetical protein
MPINLPGQGWFAVVSDDAGEAPQSQPATLAYALSVWLGRSAVSGPPYPVVAILPLIALFTTLSGKPPVEPRHPSHQRPATGRGRGLQRRPAQRHG